MNIVSYSDFPRSQIIDFIAMCYRDINRTIDLKGKDKDLLCIKEEYCSSGGEFFILAKKDAIIGTIAIKFITTPKGLIGEIHRLYVHPKHQKNGYGGKLIKTAYSYAKVKGANYIRGTTERRLKDAVNLFLKHGAYEIPKYRKSCADTFFEKEINENMYNPDCTDFANEIRESFDTLEKKNRETLILNPVENYPKAAILFPCASPIHGLYNTDSVRSNEQKQQSKIQFSGRNKVTEDVNLIYKQWAKLMGAEALTMRLLSGLHAHIVLFMAITNIGDKVLLLPEVAGGHMATKAILTRLGLEVKELPIDLENQKVDIAKSKALINEFNPKVVFVDRSEGLVYEDFSWLNEVEGTIKIFDASQYLTNIIAGDYTNPFEMGFDFILSTMHKNLPGPQRAFICCKKETDIWRQLKSGISTFVSNMHFHSIYSAGLLLEDFSELQSLSKTMLKNTLLLDCALRKHDTNTISRKITDIVPQTHHIWIPAPSPQKAFQWYTNLERVGVLVNYRKLPYNLGYGLRLGLSAATYRGLRENHIEFLADIVSRAMESPSDNLSKELQRLLKQMDGEKYAC